MRALSLSVLLATVAVAATVGLLARQHVVQSAQALRPDTFQVAVPAAAFGGGTLAQGSCVGYRPTQGDRHETVLVDPGHGGLDPGTEGSTSGGVTLEEKDLTLRVSLALRDRLRALGYTVVLTRTRDSSLIAVTSSDTSNGYLTSQFAHREMLARIACANASGAKALLSVHFNGFYDPTVGGAETYFDAARSFSGDSERLAALVQGRLVTAFHDHGWSVPDRGVLTDDGAGTAYSTEAQDYGHLMLLGPSLPGWNDAPTAMPAALTEPLFTSRPTEADVAGSSAGVLAMAGRKH